jgi:adenylate cyclase
MSEETKNQTLNENDDEIVFADEEDDEIVFADEDDELIYANPEDKKNFFPTPTSFPLSTGDSWKILIVDDEAEIHQITKLVLNEFTFDGIPLTFISAYSGEEAKALIEKHPDTALDFARCSHGKR